MASTIFNDTVATFNDVNFSFNGAAYESGYGLFGFDPDGGQFELLAVQGGILSRWPQTGSFTQVLNGLTQNLQTTIIKAGQLSQNDIAIISNGTDNVYAMYQDHTTHDLGDTNTSPPKTTALVFYGNRIWALKSNLIYFSDAYPADYSAAFDRTTNAFRAPVGTARAIIGTRDQGLILLGSDQIWQLSPSVVPNPATDSPQKVLEIGCVCGYTAVQVADDIYFLSADGVRGLFRTALDKLQTGESFPLSYPLQDEFNAINWDHIDKSCAVYFDNKFIISLTVNNSSYNNICWVYYPAYKSWVVYEGWNIARFAKLRVSGKEVLYGIDSVTGKVYQLFSGTTDNGNPIVYDEISRAEDFQKPLQTKMGGEVRVRVKGGNGTIIVYANPDGQGFIQLGTMNLIIIGFNFPVTFPVQFNNVSEKVGTWHLDDNGINKFRKCSTEIYCESLNSVITVLETTITAFQDEYISEEI